MGELKFENNPGETNEKEFRINHLGEEKLRLLVAEFEKDSAHFYENNKLGEKNPALSVLVELHSKFIREVWEDQGMMNSEQVVRDAKNVAMFVVKYLGADIAGWVKVSPETAMGTAQEMGEQDFKENCKLIVEKIKAIDPVFSQFLTRICVGDIQSGEMRSSEEMIAIADMVALIAGAIYEQIKKDGKMN